MPTPNLYIFDDIATDQHRLLLQAELFREYIQEHAPAFVPTPPKRILDLGCGGGYLTVVLQDVFPDAEIVGIDRSPESLATAERQPRLGPKTSFVLADFQEMMPAGPFDLVYISMVLMYVRELEPLMERIYEQMAPGGTIWVKDLYPNLTDEVSQPDAQFLTQNLVNMIRRIGQPGFVGEVLPPILRQVGFTDIRVEGDESYEFGGDSVEGEISTTDLIATMRSARKLISRVMNISEEAILHHCDALVAASQARDQDFGRFHNVNIVARRPLE
jgi:ubiquinone/menaquinone biosynthesis C-methylase UbiE